MSKANVYNWIKKTIPFKKEHQILEKDELYWFVGRKGKGKTREDCYVIPIGWTGYLDVGYPGKHVRNVKSKDDTYTVESVNADLRHYIPMLRRRSRCFPRSIETLRAVLEVFADAYSRFGVAKMRFRQGRDPRAREVPFSLLDFL